MKMKKTETKLFHFHRIFKKRGARRGVQATPLSDTPSKDPPLGSCPIHMNMNDSTKVKEFEL